MDSWIGALILVAVLWAVLGPTTIIAVLGLRRRIPNGTDAEDRQRALTRALFRRWYVGGVSAAGGGVIFLVAADSESGLSVAIVLIVGGTLFGLWARRRSQKYAI